MDISLLKRSRSHVIMQILSQFLGLWLYERTGLSDHSHHVTNRKYLLAPRRENANTPEWAPWTDVKIVSLKNI